MHISLGRDNGQQSVAVQTCLSHMVCSISKQWRESEGVMFKCTFEVHGALPECYDVHYPAYTKVYPYLFWWFCVEMSSLWFLKQISFSFNHTLSRTGQTFSGSLPAAAKIAYPSKLKIHNWHFFKLCNLLKRCSKSRLKMCFWSHLAKGGPYVAIVKN